ncbi:MAG: hypothetical protein ACRDL4_16170 [Thermoleophilaceae bacterium]
MAALFEAQDGMPTVWSSYVTGESADATAARATELGGTLLMEPFDVMEAGRMTVLQDPTGAVLSAWEPRASIGAHFVNGPGALTLNQLNTGDPEAAQRFYSELFGWRTEEQIDRSGAGQPAPSRTAGGEQQYWGIYLDDRLNGGMMPMPAGMD